MLTYPNIDPVAFSLGPLKVHWYGLTYLAAFLLGWWLGRIRAKREDNSWTQEQIGDLVFYVALGVILGGRLGYILFYDFANFINDPKTIFQVWKGGMSFHGGLIGVLVAMWLLGRKTRRGFFEVADFVAPLVPTGLLAGRIGNFINSELWGKPTDLPWGFQLVPGGPALHPSQLYEGMLEGVALFIILWVYSSRQRPVMAVSGMFLLFYGIFRFLVEFVRVPDAQLGYLALNWVTMGQILSMPMIVFGLVLLGIAYKNKKVAI
jgi:phosphatidylglycerol:prolipoprotein diacylglycerol transferase